jgi:hypothetical protein
VARRHSQESALQWFQQLNSAVFHQSLLMIDLQPGKLLLELWVQLLEFVQLDQLAQVLGPLLLQGRSCQHYLEPLLARQVCTQR